MLVVEQLMLVPTAELPIQPDSLSKRSPNPSVNTLITVIVNFKLISFFSSGHFHGSVFVSILCRLFLEGTCSYSTQLSSSCS